MFWWTFRTATRIDVNYFEFEYDCYDEQDIYLDISQTCINIGKILHNNEAVYNISPREFEELIAEVFARRGYNVEITQSTRDGGCDIIATKNID